MSKLNDIFFTQVSKEEVTYESVLEDVQRYFTENHAATIASEDDAERAAEFLKELISQYIVKRKYNLEGLTTDELTAKLYEDMAGYSFLKKWIYMPSIEEVNINAYDDIEVIMNSGRGIKIPDKFSSPQQAIDVVRRMLSACGMVIDDTMPSVIGYLDKNIRISVDKAPIVDCDVGINASIRIINQQTVTREKLLTSGSATEEMLDFLNACIRYGVSVCIAGATSSGKTTIMAWLLSRVPYNRRLITLEEGSREFSLIVKDENGKTLNSVVHLLTRPHENPQLNIDQGFLLERILRKHPDVIGVGEMRSAREALAAAEASRTGHTVVTTIHSNSAAQTYRRMMTLAKTRNAIDDETLMQIMVEAYPIVIFTKQLEDRSRRITEIIEGEDFVDGQLKYRSLYRYRVEDNRVKITKRTGNQSIPSYRIAEMASLGKIEPQSVYEELDVVEVVGHHQKERNISDTLKKRLLDNGISHKELDQFIKEVG
jgi:pilus assembly protein CpaF